MIELRRARIGKDNPVPFEIIDLLQNPQLARWEQILTIPPLVRSQAIRKI